jgi:Tol biopolymer transport system component
MKLEPGQIDELVGAVADRSRVEWDDELRSAVDGQNLDLLEQLKAVDLISELHGNSQSQLARIGDFRIVREIGRGSMGIVYEATQVSLKRSVALKVLPPGMTANPKRLRRFEREAKALAALNHPSIVTVHTVESEGDLRYLTMELVRGEALSRRISRQGMPLEEFLNYAVPIADAVSAAHEQGITHRDLKPANIMITTEERIKILDFGLAKLHHEVVEERLSDEVTRSTTLTQTGAMVGTIPYMSPEQVEGGSVDHRSDLFSLGVIFYEMATGQRPFRAGSHEELMATIRRESPQSVTDLKPDLPIDLGRIIRHCLQKDPERRYQTAKGLRNELEELKIDHESNSGLLASGSGERPTVPRSRRLRVAPGIVTAALFLAVALIWGLPWLEKQFDRRLPPWTPRQITSDPGWEKDPALSPDGDLVAYISNKSGNPDLWVSDARGGDALQLTEEPTREAAPAWFPDGSAIAFVSERNGAESIWKVPRLGGASVHLVPDAIDPAISPDGTRIAFARIGAEDRYRIAVAPLDDAARAVFVTDGDDGMWNHVHPAWSPDGSSLCYNDFNDLWVVPSAGGEARRLVEHQETDRYPVWSPSGRYAYFDSFREGALALWRVEVDSGVPVRLTLGTGPESQPTISENGRRIAYSTYWFNMDLEIIDLETRQRTRIPGPDKEISPVFAPDGSEIVFSSEREGEFDLWVQELNDGRPVGAPQRLAGHPGSASTKAISSDGAWLAYARVVDRQRDIWIIPTQGGEPRRFTDHPAIDLHPDWSPDGKTLAFVSDRDGRDHLWVAPVANGARQGEAKQLTFGETTDLYPAWSPNGRRLAYLTAGETGTEVVILTSDGSGSPRQITTGAEARFVRWDPGGQALWVSGSWGGRLREIRRVALRDGAVSTLQDPLILGESVFLGTFDVSRDGRRIVCTIEEVRGDIWSLEADEGSF